MSGLTRWRARRGLELAQVAGALGCSIGLLARIEAGEVEPARELATLLHVLTGGEIGICQWPSLAAEDPLELQAIGACGVHGWGVVLLAGATSIRWLTAEQARLLASALELAAGSIGPVPGELLG